MSRTNAPTRAVFLDALGTLVELEPPAPRLASLLGVPDDERLQTAVRNEMSYYRDHAHEGHDEVSLLELRERCAALIAEPLGVELDVATLMEAIRFRAFADSEGALAMLQERGLALYCVSNWDFSLPEVLDRIGLGGLLDGVVTSAQTGIRKPDPGIFEVALRICGCEAAEVIHVGDSPLEDLAGARAAGIAALLIDRGAEGGKGSAHATTITSLAEISHHLRP